MIPFPDGTPSPMRYLFIFPLLLLVSMGHVFAHETSESSTQERLHIKAQVGLLHDSNILQSLDNSTVHRVIDKGDKRWLANGQLNYIFFQDDFSNLRGDIALSNTQSFSTDFVEADPLVFSAGAPYRRYGTHNKRPYAFTLTPRYEALYVDHNRSGQQTHILSALMLSADYSATMRPDWRSGYGLGLRQDDSLLPGVSDDNEDNIDAIKYSFQKTETFWLDKNKRRTLTGSLTYTLNDAKGSEKKYDRYELSASFSAPLSFSTSTQNFRGTDWKASALIHRQNYAESAENRKDTLTTLALTLNTRLSKSWGWGAHALYANNNSTLSVFDYSQHTFMMTIDYTWAR